MPVRIYEIAKQLGMESKTVLLKAIGLMAALVQAGVLPPLAEGSQLPVFRRIFADIGDHQSIAASLSTFIAHVAALRGILAEADASSLVLVDEIGRVVRPRSETNGTNEGAKR